MKKPVLVLGGGIAGIQAATDLAGMGVPVFLVESSPSIGGRMAELDKTFPTNDCSACILAPKLTDCANHPLIHTMTMSELVQLRGDAPNFTAVIRTKPRYVEESLCKGCDDCMAVCPIEKQNRFDQNLSTQKAIYKPYPQAVPNKAVIEKKGASPCKTGCPAGMDAHGYMALAARGRYAEGLSVVQRTTPFAGVLGRVCFHPCEANCTRRYADEPLSLAGVKRFLADKARAQHTPAPQKAETRHPQKIAIVGAGPAGLNCAYQLARAGFTPTLFEEKPKAGGMLRYGIPDFRLDKTVLDEEIETIEQLGARFVFGRRLGQDFTLESLRKEGYEAVFLAIGAQQESPCGFAGEANPAVRSGIGFLQDVNSGKRPKLGQKVLVIGGGNVAMDAARAAVRLGAEVQLLYRRTRAEMPAAEVEIHHAEEEGVQLLELSSPVETQEENGKLTGLWCQKNQLAEPDASGRRRPVSIEGSEFLLPCDTVITAVGQQVDETCLPENAPHAKNRSKHTLALCGQEGLFAGGDMLRGPATVIEVIADGNRAAAGILRHFGLDASHLDATPLTETPLEKVCIPPEKSRPRATMPTIPLPARTQSFAEVETGYTEETVRTEAARCLDCSTCSECRLCEEACTSGAINHRQRAKTHEIEVGAVVLATGCNITQNVPPALGLGTVPGVVTNLAYERILSASGPFGGHIQRPEDGKVPKRIAFLHCVGSRDVQCGADYCSSVCCMQTVKAARITREHMPNLEATDLYYMDMRAYGKDFERYVQESTASGAIRLVRSRPSACKWDAETGEILLFHTGEDGRQKTSRYDMVVLALGLRPGADNRSIAKTFGITTDKFNFFRGQDFPAPKTQRKGFFACGAGSGPKDIPETVVEASAAAAGAARFVAYTNTNLYQNYAPYFKEEPEVPERDISKEPVRIGVFVCHCGANIGGILDVPAITRYAAGLPFVALAEDSLYTCSADAQKHIAEMIVEHRLNRVVIASCTPRTHEGLFQKVLQKAGLNPALCTMANIRDQCSWVHMAEGQSATEKAKDLVSMAVARVFSARQLGRARFSVHPAALILGGGPAGLAAAVCLVRTGFPVHIVEKEAALGGNARKLTLSSAGRPLWPHIDAMIRELETSGLATFHLESEVQNVQGHVGQFKSTLSTPGGETGVEHGAVIVAVGGREATPEGYLFGQDPRVITHRTLEEGLISPLTSLDGIENIVMIQCAGSRNDERPYCSRICCATAVRNAVRIKRHNPDIHVTVLFREMRTYGTSNAEYSAARAAGVEFIRFADGQDPTVHSDQGALFVRVHDPILEREITLPADLVSLAAAIEPNLAENRQVAQLLKVPLNADGFFLEAHAKLRPVDFATEGVFLAGLAHSPRSLREAVVQGRAAAARAATILSKPELLAEGQTARVDPALCTACGACEATCPYGAVTLRAQPQRGGGTRLVAEVNDVLCKGCGGCASACRCGAIDLAGSTTGQVLAELSALLAPKPR